MEVFSPIVYEPFKDSAWPATGSVLLDELPFIIRRTAPGGSTPSAYAGASFSILAAMGWDKTGKRMRLYKLEAVPGHHMSNGMRTHWENFMKGLPGEPKRVVCDQKPADYKSHPVGLASITHSLLRIPFAEPLLSALEDGRDAPIRHPRL